MMQNSPVIAVLDIATRGTLFPWTLLGTINKKATPSTALLLAVAILASLVSTTEARAQDQNRPNILFIVSDDTGFGDLGPYGVARDEAF